MRFTYDWEFLEDGETIHPISVGAVCEDGREYYAVNSGADWARVEDHKWFRENVLPHLPVRPVARLGLDAWRLDFLHPDVKSLSVMKSELLAFFRVGLVAGEDAELWGCYPSYDHVCLCQLWGPLALKPSGIPMRTGCLGQHRVMMERQFKLPVGALELPTQEEGTEYHALYDARYDMVLARSLGVI